MVVVLLPRQPGLPVPGRVSTPRPIRGELLWRSYQLVNRSTCTQLCGVVPVSGDVRRQRIAYHEARRWRGEGTDGGRMPVGITEEVG